MLIDIEKNQIFEDGSVLVFETTEMDTVIIWADVYSEDPQCIHIDRRDIHKFCRKLKAANLKPIG